MNSNFAENLPVAPLKLVALDSVLALGKSVDEQIVYSRKKMLKKHPEALSTSGYEQDTYLAKYQTPRFGTGEAKGSMLESVRGTDIYILADVVNHSITYSINGEVNKKSPDDHFQDLKRIIGACSGHPHRINVIMPFLYEGRQHRRSNLESLDCALALQELSDMGVKNIITFDAHDPKVQNAIPLCGFDNFFTTLQFLRSFFDAVPDAIVDSDHMMVISPDEGGMSRAVYYATMLGLDMGMFYKRRDYSTIINGKNPIVAHEFLGNSVKGKDVFILDDMIASGESMLDVAKELKKRDARNIYIGTTYGLFTEGLEKFDDAYNKGLISRILTTNLTYQSPELLSREYYTSVDLSKYIALIIDTINHDTSVTDIINPTKKIQKLLQKHKK
jgi:ribose-phosphate pyrophosphokinase